MSVEFVASSFYSIKAILTLEISVSKDCCVAIIIVDAAFIFLKIIYCLYI